MVAEKAAIEYLFLLQPAIINLIISRKFHPIMAWFEFVVVFLTTRSNEIPNN